MRQIGDPGRGLPPPAAPLKLPPRIGGCSPPPGSCSGCGVEAARSGMRGSCGIWGVVGRCVSRLQAE